MTFKPQNNEKKSPNNLAIMGQLYVPLSVWTGTINVNDWPGWIPSPELLSWLHIGEVDGWQHVYTINVKVKLN